MIDFVISIISIGLIVGALVPFSQENPEQAEAVNRIYLPHIQTGVDPPAPNGQGSWRQGVKLHTEYDPLPHFTIEIYTQGLPENFKCTHIVMWNVVQQKYIDADPDGHWRVYPEYPDLWGPQFYQFQKRWVLRHPIEALKASNYWAWCE